jgi:hypothetical protein
LDFISVFWTTLFCSSFVSVTGVLERVGSGVAVVVTTGMVSRGWVVLERSKGEAGVEEGVAMGVVAGVVSRTGSASWVGIVVVKGSSAIEAFEVDRDTTSIATVETGVSVLIVSASGAA